MAFQDGVVLKSVDRIQVVPFIVSLSMAVYRIEGLHPLGHPLTVGVLRKTIQETVRLYSSDVSRSVVTGLPYEI